MSLSSMPLQSVDEVLQRLSVFRLQQRVLLAENNQVGEESVKVWIQSQSKHLTIVRPVNVSQDP